MIVMLILFLIQNLFILRWLNTTPIFIQYNSEYIDDYGVWKVPLSELNSVREHSMLDKICYRSLDDVEACSRMSKNELFKLIIDQAKLNTQSQTQDRSFHL